MEEEKKTGNAKVGDKYFHGTIRYQMREYWLDEVHDPEKFKGKWCINVQVPGVNHDPQIFTIGVNDYDNEPDNDEFDDKRPALFYTLEDARAFCMEMHFPQKTLRLNQITEDLIHHKLFATMGAYLVKRSTIVIPRMNVNMEEMIRKASKPAYENTGGIFLP